MLRHPILRHWVGVVLSLVCVAYLAGGCRPVIEVHGAEPDSSVVEGFQVGVTTVQEVALELGSPLAQGTFRPDVWYYMFSRSETIGFLEPKIAYRRIYAFDFSEEGLLENIATYTEADGEDVKFSSRVTPSRGTELNFFQELFGNIGRFVGDDDDRPRTPAPGRSR